MKDLYRKLGIDPKASTEDVAAALELNPDMSHCSHILTNEEKRATYNQAHATLNAIGILRHRLGLDSDESWFLETCPHFAPRLQVRKQSAATRQQAPEVSTPGSDHEAFQQAESGSRPPAKTSHNILIIAGVVIVALAILAYTFL